MSLPKLSDKVREVLKAPEKDLRKLLKESPIGAPPKLSAALGKAGKALKKRSNYPLNYQNYQLKGKRLVEKLNSPNFQSYQNFLKERERQGFHRQN